MTLSAIFRWKHPDSTSDMNKRLQTLVPRGIFDGGEVTAGSGLTVHVSAGIAIGYDGMLVQDDAVQILGVVANTTNYIVVRAKYASGTTPTVQWEVMTQTAYNNDSDKNYLIVYAVVTLASGVTSVASANISTLARDTVDPLTRSPYRGNTVFASLPTHPPVQNRDGDFYFLTDLGTFYWWNATTTTWDAFTTGSYNVETGSMTATVIQGERDRQLNGSGVLGGKRPADGFASELDIELVETPSVDSQIGFNTFSATVNGHYVQPYARYITLTAKPVATRYDLIFLEVYREAITVPENHDFPRNPDGTSTYTITQVSDQVEQQLWEAGVGGNNFDLNELQSDDHLWTVTKYRIGIVSSVAVGSLQDNQLAASLAQNVDGSFFSAPSGVAPGTDERTWTAASTTAKDGFSWAIPLFVVKRTVSEDHTVGNAIKIYRDDIRYVFPVYPVADTEQAARLTVDTVAREQPFNYATETQVDYTKPSGFINGLDYPIQNVTGINNVQMYEEEIRFRIRGLEDTLRINAGPSFSIDGAPATGYERHLVYLKMSYTLYHNDPTQNFTMISDRHRPLITDQVVIGYPFKGMGWKRGYVTYEVAYYNLGAATRDLDEHDSMVSAGWTKGDASMAAFGQQYSDGGIWSKVASVSTDERVPIFGREWAIPVCLIHRRNVATWNWSTNPNGSGVGRPDGAAVAAVPVQDEILDLRRQVDVDEARLAEMLESDIDKLMRGQLRTRMAERWAGTAGIGGPVAGTRLLQSDHADVSGASLAHRMSAPNGSRKIWSDAREFVPVATSFPLDVDLTGDDYVTYTVLTGALVIKAPTGSFIVRNLPSSFLVGSATGAATYLQFNGEPCWSTQADHTQVYPTPATLKWIDAVSGLIEEQNVFDAALGTELNPSDDPAFTITASDALGHATQMSLTLTDLASYASADIMTVSFWVMYDRTTTGVYAGNSGLAEIPDEVYSVVKDPGGTPIETNVGTLYTTVRKTTTVSTDIVITSADILTASGTSGTAATIVGFDASSSAIIFDSAPGVTFSTATLNATQDTLTLTYSGAFAAGIDVDIVVYYYTDLVDEWVEVGRGGKSVRAYYSWHEEDLDLLTTPPAQTYAFDIGTSVWHDAEVGGNMDSMPMLWESATGTSGPWTWVASLSDQLVGHQYSGMVSFDANALLAQRYCKVVMPKWTPPANSSADEFLIHYSYTPYNGLSGTGGAVAVPATAVPKLKKMLHGTVEANSQHTVTQSGACSIFGGVNSWSGAQVRYPQVNQNFEGGRFRQYNQTQLVKSTKANGSMDLGPGSGAADQMYAGAVMRLPYPANPAMLTVGSLYHDAVMEWDLDPGREGAGSGYMCMAPGYWGGLAFVDTTNGLHYDQFCSGLAVLAAGGVPLRQDNTSFIPACAFQPDSGLVSADYSPIKQGWEVVAGETFSGDAPVPTSRGMIPLLVTTEIQSLDTTDLDGGGVLFYGPTLKFSTGVSGYFDAVNTFEYTSPVTLDGTNSVLVCSVPGTAAEYNNRVYQDVYPILRIDLGASATGATRYVLQSLVVQDGPTQYTHNGGLMSTFAYDETRVVDTIQLPFGSSSHGMASAFSTADPASSIAASSLRGKTIQYPASWGASSKTAVEALVVASTIFRSTYGRGLYLGSTTRRYNMPTLVPGSGTPLSVVAAAEDIHVEQTAQPPDQFPVASSASAFAPSVRSNPPYDHGGAIGYSFYGVVINPSDDDYAGLAVMQLSGGPLGSRFAVGATSPVSNSDVPDGTALDAMWMSHRPILRTK